MLKAMIASLIIVASTAAFASEESSADKRHRRGHGGVHIGIGSGGFSIGWGWGGRPHRPHRPDYGYDYGYDVQRTCVAQNLRGMTFRGYGDTRYEAQQNAYYRCLRVSRACRVVSCY